MKTEKSVIINNTEIKVEIADTTEKQIKGLGNKTSLEKNHGMLFTYPDYKIRSFWMKDMNFPIDIIWLADDQIVGMEKNVPTQDNKNLTRYYSPKPVNYVLEINANEALENNFKVGDKIKFNF
ncbi:MAG: DUF192 domain-containing protein [Candidatus Buchananbacteria bacterium]